MAENQLTTLIREEENTFAISPIRKNSLIREEKKYFKISAESRKQSTVKAFLFVKDMFFSFSCGGIQKRFKRSYKKPN